MAVSTDFKKEPDDIILDLINNSQSPIIDLTFTDVDLTGYSATGEDASVVITAKPDTDKYKGQQTATYKRVNLFTVVGNANDRPTMIVQPGKTLADYQDVINYVYGTNLVFDNVTMQNFTIPILAEGTEFNFQLTALSENKIYFGEGTVNARIAGEDDLVNKITNPDLDGLEWRRYDGN